MAETRELIVARRAVSIEFIAAGFVIATWASRIPQVRDALDLSPAALGLLILSFGTNLFAMPMAGAFIHRYGSARVIVVTSLIAAAGLAVAGVGVSIGIVPVVLGLMLLGLGLGTWDVAMNVEGAAVERHIARPLMPRLHAGFSIGTVVGALIGVGMNALGVSVTVHFVAVAILAAIVVPTATKSFIPDDVSPADASGKSHAARSWLEPRTIAIGLFTFIAALSEGVGNDWIGVASIDGYQAEATQASIAYFVFVTAMTATRWWGHYALEAYGRVPVLRASIALAFVGVLVFVFGPNTWTAGIGIVMWGAGSALGFPVSMSAAADDPARAAVRVSVVSTLGYLAFLAGPTVIGFVGNSVGTLRALLVTAVLLAAGIFLASATRPLQPDATQSVA